MAGLLITTTRGMDNGNNNTLIGFAFGFAGGLARLVAQINTAPYSVTLSKALLTAFLCGMAGVAGKEVYLWVRKKIKAKRDEAVVANVSKKRHT